MLRFDAIPAFGEDGHLPRGRYPIDMNTACELLVADERFAKSESRQRLSDNFTEYLLSIEGYQTPTTMSPWTTVPLNGQRRLP